MTARKAAFTSLLRCEKAGKYTNLELDSAIRKYSLDESERALFTALLYGVTEKAITLDYIIGLFSKVPGGKISPAVRVILRMGIYQILFLDRIPDHAAVDESVELAKTYARSAAGFVNALLRRTVRERENITYPDIPTMVGIRSDLFDMWCDQYGRECAEDIARSLSHSAYMTLHANTLRLSAQELMDQIECESRVGALCGDCVELCESMPTTDFAPLEDGECFVQDQSSAYAASLVDARPGMTVIDTCACPGGKSFAMALSMHNSGRVYSFDLHDNKLSLIVSGARRLGISIIETAARDGRDPDPALFGAADRVLCDVPCSGFGVLRKKPDLRSKPVSDAEHLPEVQYAILSASSYYLRQGGMLVYSTCTLNKKENEDVVTRFLAENTDFESAPFDGDTYMRTIFPHEYSTDGFFVARLRKK